MRKLSNDELAQAHDRKDWHALWLAARPLVKFTIRDMVRRGEIEPGRAGDQDLAQEGLLAAGAAVRKWSTFEGAFSTWVAANIRLELLNHFRKASRNGFGGGGDLPFVVSAEERVRRQEEDGDEDEGTTHLDLMVYEDEVLPSPETAMARTQALRLLEKLGPGDADVVRRLFGIGQQPQSLAEIADLRGVSRKQARGILDRVWRLLALRPS